MARKALPTPTADDLYAVIAPVITDDTPPGELAWWLRMINAVVDPSDPDASRIWRASPTVVCPPYTDLAYREYRTDGYTFERYYMPERRYVATDTPIYAP